MAEEKILNEEVLEESELEEVAGGTLKETVEDHNYLEKWGAYDFNSEDGFKKSVQNGFAKMGSNYGMEITADIDLNKNSANKYFVNGKEISRNKLLKILDTLAGK